MVVVVKNLREKWGGERVVSVWWVMYGGCGMVCGSIGWS